MPSLPPAKKSLAGLRKRKKKISARIGRVSTTIDFIGEVARLTASPTRLQPTQASRAQFIALSIPMPQASASAAPTTPMASWREIGRLLFSMISRTIGLFDIVANESALRIELRIKYQAMIVTDKG